MDSISPAVLRKVTRELYALENDPPEGIRLIMNEESMTDIQAWIQGPEGTPYEGGCFRIRIQLSADFPNAPPKCFFITKIFHPNVSKQGDICVSTLKKDWKKDLGLRHILLVIKCLLIFPNPESALNEEAGRQLIERYDDYAKHACLLTSIHATPMRQDIFQPHGGEASNTGREAGLQQESRTVRGKSVAVVEGGKDLNPPGSVEGQRFVFATQSIPGTVTCVQNMQFTSGQHPRPTMNKPSFHHNQQQQYHTTQQIPKLAPSLIGQPCKEDIPFGGAAIFKNTTGVITRESPALLHKAVPRLVYTGTPTALSSRLLTRHNLDSQTHVAKKRTLRRL